MQEYKATFSSIKVEPYVHDQVEHAACLAEYEARRAAYRAKSDAYWAEIEANRAANPAAAEADSNYITAPCGEDEMLIDAGAQRKPEQVYCMEDALS